MKLFGFIIAPTKRASELVTVAELFDLITVYPDDDAHEQLDKLRSRFWADDKVGAATNQIVADMRESNGEPE